MTEETQPGTLLSHHQSLHMGGSLSLLGLVVIWSRDEPERMGEVLLIPPTPEGGYFEIGRKTRNSDQVASQLTLGRQRPGQQQATGGFRTRRLSRRQLKLRADAGESLEVINIGQRALLHNGEKTPRATVRPGDTVGIERALLFLCVSRPLALPMPHGELQGSKVPFGGPDAVGMVGESPVMWQLRGDIGFIAPRPAHVLIQGPSGAGKELVARAIHRLSPRHRHGLVSQNCAAIPESLIEAELFGNSKNYPNPGTAERPGLIGAADGSTLFLDEIGELSDGMQARLLRVMDGGEYMRLGDASVRQADLRIVAATNRPEDGLKHDIFARMKLKIEIPGLNERREDIPLLLRHLLRLMGRNDPALVAPYFPEGDLQRDPEVSEKLVRRLVTHTYKGHVRELESMVWEAIRHSTGNVLEDPQEGAGAASSGIPPRPAAFDRVIRESTGAVDASGDAVEPSEEAAEPSAGVATPSAGVATPSAGVATPSAEVAAPSAGTAAPSAGTAAPSAGVAAPSAEVADPIADADATPNPLPAMQSPEELSQAFHPAAPAFGQAYVEEPLDRRPRGFSERDWALIQRQRAHGFSATACARDSAYPGGRTGADFQLRVWMCKALKDAGWGVVKAAAVLEGGEKADSSVLTPRLRRFVGNLTKGLESRGEEAMRRYLQRQYAQQGDHVLELLDALIAGKVV